MKKDFIFLYKVNGVRKTISFGSPDTLEEKDEMYKLRYAVYLKRGYINANNFEEKKDIDLFDKKGDCDYFIAKMDNVIIGSARVIKGSPLPIEEYFNFNTPDKIKNITPDNKLELSRLVISHNLGEDRPQRHIILLFLIYLISLYAEKNKYEVSYAFIKGSLFKKLTKLRFPMNRINFKEFNYPTTGVLYKYFNQKEDPVVPFFFTLTEVRDYTDKHLLHSKMFNVSNLDIPTFTLSNGLYLRFLKLLNIF